MRISDDALAKGLLTLTNWFGGHTMWHCGMAMSMEASFEESYAIRAMLRAEQTLHLGRLHAVAHAASDRNLLFQSIHEEDMFDMGYGYNKDAAGMVNCSCVADASSVASAVVETATAVPGYPENSSYLDSVRRFIEHVLQNYLTETGVIGVGILNHKVNPMKEYWCANALFTETMLLFAQATGETKYYDAAIAPCEFLATFDYEHTDWSEWDTSPSEVILYTSSGILAALKSDEMKKRLNKPPVGVLMSSGHAESEAAAEGQAMNRVTGTERRGDVDFAGKTVYDLLCLRWGEFADWLAKNQNPDGIYTPPTTAGARTYEPGLTWTILEAEACGLTDERLNANIARQLNGLNTNEAKLYFGLYSNPFPTSLAYLSFAAEAQRRMRQDEAAFTCALERAMQNPSGLVW